MKRIKTIKRVVVLLLAVSGIAVGFWWHSRPVPAGDQPIMLPSPPSVGPRSIDTLLPPDSIRAIDEPQFETADQAARHLKSDERVIGLVVNGEARAYPIPILRIENEITCPFAVLLLVRFRFGFGMLFASHS